MKHIKPYKLFEDHQQLNIPFREPKYRGKSVHEHIEDALIDLQSMDADKYYSKGNPDDEIDKNIAEAIDLIINATDENSTIKDYLFSMFYGNRVIDDNGEIASEIYNKKAIKKFLKSEDWSDIDTMEIINNKYDDFVTDLTEYVDREVSKPKEMFTKDGWAAFYDMVKEDVEEQLYDFQSTVDKSYQNDDVGLIEIWRTVDYNREDKRDIYSAITKNYGGVGVYWSWDQDKAEAYWGGKGHKITLYGKVSVENVDWEDSVYKNCYYMKEEREIRIKDGGDVMIVGFFDETIKKYHEFEKPYVVKTGGGKFAIQK